MGTGPPEISINAEKFYSMPAQHAVLARQLLKRLRTLKVFSFVCTPHAEKNLCARRRSSGPSAWNADWSLA